MNYSVCDSCGNGRTAYTQQCDDGNLNAGDGCSSICTVESGYVCSNTSPSVCSRTSCGDGVGDTLATCPSTVIQLTNSTTYPVSRTGTFGGSNAYYTNRDGTCNSLPCSTYPYKAFTVANTTGSAQNLVFEVVFSNTTSTTSANNPDGYIRIVNAPFDPSPGMSSTISSNDDGHSSCYTSYIGYRHSCIRLSMPAGAEWTIVAMPLGSRSTSSENVSMTLSIYRY